MKGVAASLALSVLLCACGSDGPAAANPDGTGGSPSGGTAGSGTSGSPSGGAAGSGTGGASGSGPGGAAGSVGGTGGKSGAGGGGAVTRGAVSLHVGPGAGCSIADSFQDFPELASGHPVTATEKEQAVEQGGTSPDGEPVSVLCSWLGRQSPYTFDAVIKIGQAGAQRMVNVGAVMKQGATVEGGVVFSSSDLPKSFGSDPQGPCHYDVISVDEAKRSIWGHLRCDIFSTLDGSDSCILADSYFFFENCVVPTAP